MRPTLPRLIARLGRTVVRTAPPYVDHVPQATHCSSCGLPSRFPTVENSQLAATLPGWPYPEPVKRALATRENYPCVWCGRNYRTRVLAEVALPHLPGARVYEPAARTAFAPIARRRAMGYWRSEFLEGVPDEPRRTSVPHEDLQSLSFGPSSFDLVITSEVLEHVADPWSAFSELRRVLRIGGRHVFTVPHVPGPTRARPESDVRHVDPLRPEGVPVVTDFGDDLPALLAAHGFITSVHRYPGPTEVARVYESIAS